MKKIVAAILLFLVLGLAGIIFPLSFHYDAVQLEKNMLAHVMSCAETGLRATYQGQTTLVTGRNIDRIASTLTVVERQRLWRKPGLAEEDALVINFPDGARFTVAEEEPGIDKALIIYRYKRKTRYFRISGYKTFSWLSRAISPEGVYNENELLPGQD